MTSDGDRAGSAIHPDNNRSCPHDRPSDTGADRDIPEHDQTVLDALAESRSQADNQDAEKAMTIIDGVYALHQRLGKGGMAVVYLATVDLMRFDYTTLYAYTQVQGTSHAERRKKAEALAGTLREQHLDLATVRAILKAQGIPMPEPRVAVKVSTLGEEHVPRFHGEWKNLMCLNHKNVVRVYGGGSYQNRPYYAMELLHNLVLPDRIRNQFSIADKIRIVIDGARGLAYLHAKGLVHRDVKPDNLVTCEVEPGKYVTKITDLGLAKNLDEDLGLTMSNVPMGTPYYMPPEQIASSRDVDRRADIYSLGATLYDFVTGHRPFHEKTSIYEIFTAVERGETPLDPQVHNPRLPPALCSIISCAMARDPAARYRSMDDFAADLELYLATECAMVREAVDFTVVEAGHTTTRANGNRFAFETIKQSVADIAPASPAPHGAKRHPGMESRRIVKFPLTATAFLAVLVVVLATVAMLSGVHLLRSFSGRAEEARAGAKAAVWEIASDEWPLQCAITFEQDLADELAPFDARWSNVTLVPGGRVGRKAQFRGSGMIHLGEINIPPEGAWVCRIRIPDGTDPEPVQSIIGINGAGINIEDRNFVAVFHDNNNTLVGSVPVIAGRWTHLALTWGNGMRNLYIDGELRAQARYSGTPRVARSAFVIGARWTGSTRHFIGDLDELYMFDRYLSPVHVERMAHNRLYISEEPESTPAVADHHPPAPAAAAPGAASLVLVHSASFEHAGQIAQAAGNAYRVDHATRIPEPDALSQYAALVLIHGGFRLYAELEPDEIESIVAFVESGGGLICAGQAWSWSAKVYGNRPIKTHPLNLLGVPFGFQLGVNAGRPAPGVSDEAVFGPYNTWSDNWVPSGIHHLGDAIQPSLQDDRGRNIAIKGTRGNGRFVVLGSDAMLLLHPDIVISVLDYITPPID